MTLCQISWCRWQATNCLKSAEHLPRACCSHSHCRCCHRCQPQATFSLPSTWKLCLISSSPCQSCCCYCCCSSTTWKKFEIFSQYLALFLWFFLLFSPFADFIFSESFLVLCLPMPLLVEGWATSNTSSDWIVVISNSDFVVLQLVVIFFSQRFFL